MASITAFSKVNFSVKITLICVDQFSFLGAQVPWLVSSSVVFALAVVIWDATEPSFRVKVCATNWYDGKTSVPITL